MIRPVVNSTPTRCISCGRLPSETCCDICHRVARAVARLAYAIGYDETGDEMTELLTEFESPGGEVREVNLGGALG